MINVNELKRNAKNIVKKYSDAQIKVREATSNDPWGPSSTIMAEIADLTHNVVAFSEIMQMIWKRLNDHGKNWRHVFKSLVLLEYLIKTGNYKVAKQCIENIFAIQALKDFQYFEDNKDHGASVREKSKRLVALLKDPERLKLERARALKAKSRLIEAVSSSGKNSFGSSLSRSSNGSGDLSNNSGAIGGAHNSSHPYVEADSSSVGGGLRLSSELDSARPHSLTEEESQLQLALALSKEEAERQEKTRKNDELRLKLALNVSKQQQQQKANSSGGSDDLMNDFPSSSTSMTSGPSSNHKSSSKMSNIDDLLGLSFTPSEPAPTSELQLPTSSCSKTARSISPSDDDAWSIDPWHSVQEASEASSTMTQAIKMYPPSSLSSNTNSTATTLPTTQSAALTPASSIKTPATATAASVGAPSIVTTTETTVPLLFQTKNPMGTSQPRRLLSKNPFEY